MPNPKLRLRAQGAEVCHSRRMSLRMPVVLSRIGPQQS